MQQYTHILKQHGHPFRYIRMSDSDARTLLKEEQRVFKGVTLEKGPYRFDTRKQSDVPR